MASDTKTPVVLCWHMHQPSYQDMRTDQFLFPWVYLHTIKDYSDMAAHLEANPDARAVVNFAPVLLEQIETYLIQIEKWRHGAGELRMVVGDADMSHHNLQQLLYWLAEKP